MAASYLRRGMTGPATFSLFVRKLPPDRRFLITAGLDDCLSLVEDYRFSQEDLDYLAAEQGLDDAALRAFERLRFTGDVRAGRRDVYGVGTKMGVSAAGHRAASEDPLKGP